MTWKFVTRWTPLWCIIVDLEPIIWTALENFCIFWKCWLICTKDAISWTAELMLVCHTSLDRESNRLPNLQAVFRYLVHCTNGSKKFVKFPISKILLIFFHHLQAILGAYLLWIFHQNQRWHLWLNSVMFNFICCLWQLQKCLLCWYLICFPPVALLVQQFINVVEVQHRKKFHSMSWGHNNSLGNFT